MGIQQSEIDAEQVIIRTSDKDIIINKPHVAKVNMMGEETWQISGPTTETPRSATPEIKEEDIQTVMTQTGKTREEALAAIKDAEGDLAAAILNLGQ